MTRRGVSPIVGFALLVGLTALVAVGVFVVASTALDSTTNAAQQEQTRASMQAFADTTQQLREGSTSTKDFQIEGYDGGQTVVDQSSGTINVTLVENGTHRPWLNDTKLGTLQYSTPDGDTIAYQGGGVFKQTDDHVDLLRAPSLQQRGHGTSTLTLPITRIEGNATDVGRFDGELSVEDRRKIYPERGRVSLLKNDTNADFLEVRIDSEYAEAWESYARHQTNATIAGSSDNHVVLNFSVVNVDHESTSVHLPGGGGSAGWTGSTPNYTMPEADGAIVSNDATFDGASSNIIGDIAVEDPEQLRTSHSYNQSNHLNGSVVDLNYTFPDFSGEKSRLLRKSETVRPLPSNGTVSSEGTYTTDRATFDSESLNVTADEDVIVIVNETDGGGENSLTVSGEQSVNVSGTGNVTIFVEGEVEINAQGSHLGNRSAPGQVQLKAQDDITMTGQPEIYAVLWAPESDVVANGLPEIHGSIIADTVRNVSANITYNDAIRPRDYSGGGGGGSGGGGSGSGGTGSSTTSSSATVGDDGVAYVHLSETVVQVED